MNSRERILAAMRGESVDRIPFTPNLNGYNIMSMPKRFHSMARYDVLKDLGIDLLVRFRVGSRLRPPIILIPPPEGGASALSSLFARGWAASMPVTDQIKVKPHYENGAMYVTLDTPKGSLRCGWQNTPECPDFPFPIEPLLKSIEDVRIYRYVLDHTVVEPAYEELEETLAAVGEEGTCEANGGSSPVQEMIEMLMGMENFYPFLMIEHPQEMEELLEHLLEIRKQEYRVLADSPAPVIVTGENTSTTISSPAIMAQYEFPALDAYSEILHAKGKIHMVHMCGKLHNVVHLLKAAQFDGIHDLAPPPTGDFDFVEDRKRVQASGKCICGGIDCTAFARLGLEELMEYIKRRLEDPDTRLGTLAGECKFHSPSHFARFFRKMTGLRPKDYRKSIANK